MGIWTWSLVGSTMGGGGRRRGLAGGVVSLAAGFKLLKTLTFLVVSLCFVIVVQEVSFQLPFLPPCLYHQGP